MAVLIRNNVKIGGSSGGDVGIELTLAEYNKLKEDKKLKKDVNYYIIDGESSDIVKNNYIKKEDLANLYTITQEEGTDYLKSVLDLDMLNKLNNNE